MNIKLPIINEQQRILFSGISENQSIKNFLANFSKLKNIHFSVAIVDFNSISKNCNEKFDYIDKLLDHYEVSRAQFGSEIDAFPPVDESLLLKMAMYENIFMRMCDRLHPQNQVPYDVRKKMYLMQIRYWNFIISSKDINLFISTNIPHEMSDFIIYGLCKIYNIRVIIFDDVNLLPDSLFLIEDIEKSCVNIFNLYEKIKDDSTVKLDRFNDIFLGFKECTDREIIPSMQKLFIIGRQQALIVSKIKLFLSKIYHLVTMSRVKELVNYEFYIRLICSLNAKLNELKAFRFYEKHTVTPDLSKRYIYWAIHYQPECSTSPMGGCFVDQILIAQMLSYYLPKDVIVYAKEHPLQLKNRSVDFYQSIASLPNIELVNKSYSTLQLIDNAVAVATITGSAGWEAFLSGKPVMKFGNSFYQYAPGVFNVKSEKQMEVAVSEIFNGFEPDFNKIKSFLKACENASVKAWTLEEHKAALSNNSLEENTNNLCLAIIEMINNKSVN